jgi:hypothetical protein
MSEIGFFALLIFSREILTPDSKREVCVSPEIGLMMMKG